MRRNGGTTVVFDVIGTLFSLERPRTALGAIGAPPHALDVWFAQALRDAFALSLTGAYRPLREVLRAALPRTLEQLGVRTADNERSGVLETFQRLEPQRGAKEACERLSEAGFELVTLTNSSAEATAMLLEGAGMREVFSRLLSTDDAGRFKPHRDAYALLGDAAESGWFVSAHAWDASGAKTAGLKTAWVSATEKRYLDEVYPEPDVRADTLSEAAEKIISSQG